MNIKTAIDWLLRTIHKPSRIINKKIYAKEMSSYGEASEYYISKAYVLYSNLYPNFVKSQEIGEYFS